MASDKTVIRMTMEEAMDRVARSVVAEMLPRGTYTTTVNSTIQLHGDGARVTEIEVVAVSQTEEG